MLFNILIFVQIITAVSMVTLIMLQHGKGADAGPALSGGSQSFFGSGGGANVLSRITAILAFVFIVNSLAITALSSNTERSLDSVVTESLLLDEEPQENESIPRPE